MKIANREDAVAESFQAARLSKIALLVYSTTSIRVAAQLNRALFGDRGIVDRLTHRLSLRRACLKRGYERELNGPRSQEHSAAQVVTVARL